MLENGSRIWDVPVLAIRIHSAPFMLNTAFR